MKKTSKIKIAETYADALLSIAKKDNLLDKVQSDIELLSNVSSLKMLALPEIDAKKQDELLNFIKTNLNLDTVSINFLRLLIENKVIGEFQNITKTFKDKVLEAQGVIKVLVQSVQPLTEEQAQKLKKGLEKKLKKEIILENRLNESLLGGLSLNIGSLEIDDSISNKLKTIENIMKGC